MKRGQTTLLVISVTLSLLTCVQFAYSAEAVSDRQSHIAQDWQGRLPAAFVTAKRLSQLPYRETGSYESFLATTHLQIMMADEAAMARAPAQTPSARGAVVAREFAGATRFFLASLSAFEQGTSEVISLAASDISDFLSLSQDPFAIRNHHLIQHAFDDVYFLWPERDYAPADALAYRFDIAANVHYGGPAFHAFYGTLSLSFDSYQAQLDLSNSTDSFTITFGISDLARRNVVQTIGQLSHDTMHYETPLIIGFSALPDAAIKGFAVTLAPLPNTPHHVRFHNFTLPD